MNFLKHVFLWLHLLQKGLQESLQQTLFPSHHVLAVAVTHVVYVMEIFLRSTDAHRGLRSLFHSTELHPRRPEWDISQRVWHVCGKQQMWLMALLPRATKDAPPTADKKHAMWKRRDTSQHLLSQTMTRTGAKQLQGSLAHSATNK